MKDLRLMSCCSILLLTSRSSPANDCCDDDGDGDGGDDDNDDDDDDDDDDGDDHDDERARGRRPMRSCGGMMGKVNGNRQRDIRTNRTCLENGSVELVMMRRLRIELMYNSTWFLPSKVTAR